MGDEKISKRFNLQIAKKSRGGKTRMCDGYVYVLNAFYWCGDGKTMFSPILEVTTIQDGGAVAKEVYRPFLCTLVPSNLIRISGMGDEKILKTFQPAASKKIRGRQNENV